MLQVETAEAISKVEEIASVDGVDGIFIGPADLAASLGYPGEPDRPEVTSVVLDTIRRMNAIGKPVGILTPNNAFARQCIEAGTVFTAVGVDAAILARNSEALLKTFR